MFGCQIFALGPTNATHTRAILHQDAGVECTADLVIPGIPRPQINARPRVDLGLNFV